MYDAGSENIKTWPTDPLLYIQYTQKQKMFSKENRVKVLRRKGITNGQLFEDKESCTECKLILQYEDVAPFLPNIQVQQHFLAFFSTFSALSRHFLFATESRMSPKCYICAFKLNIRIWCKLLADQRRAQIIAIIGITKIKIAKNHLQ